MEKFNNFPMLKIMIKGAGEQASGTAHRLFMCGFPVVMTEIEKPTAVRRTVSFCSAVYEKEMVVESVKAISCRMKDFGGAEEISNSAKSFIPVFVEETDILREIWKPDIIIDARILKYNRDNRMDEAPLVIGYGPGLEAGADVHFVVETMRGHDLGRIIKRGKARNNTGIPGEIAGETKRRLLSAPVSGILENYKNIGDKVFGGEIICRLLSSEEGSRHDVRACLDGVLRGLCYPGLNVRQGQKLGDIDPRGTCFTTISEKARCISGSALEIIISETGCLKSC